MLLKIQIKILLLNFWQTMKILKKKSILERQVKLLSEFIFKENYTISLMTHANNIINHLRNIKIIKLKMNICNNPNQSIRKIPKLKNSFKLENKNW